MNEIINFVLGISTAFAQTSTANTVASETENQITKMVTFFITQLPLWIVSVIVIVATFIIARIVKAAVENKMTKEGFEEEHREIQIVAGRTVNAAVLIIGITIGLKIGGLDLTAILAAGAFGIGFALQDLIMNFLSGVMILTARHYTIGDTIKVNGTLGKIVEIQTRATVLKAFDGTKIVVPNSDLFKNQVTSYTSNPFRRIQLDNGVAYGSDLKKTQEVVLNAVKATKGVLVEPKPSLFFYEWGDSSVNFKVNAWVETKSGWIKTRTRLIMNIDQALADAGIEVPYPIQTVHVEKGDDTEKNLEKQVTESMNEKTAVVAQSQQPSPPPPVNAEYVDAPVWLKKNAANVVQQPAAASATEPQAPMGIPVQLQNPAPQSPQFEVPMGTSPQPLSGQTQTPVQQPEVQELPHPAAFQPATLQ